MSWCYVFCPVAAYAETLGCGFNPFVVDVYDREPGGWLSGMAELWQQTWEILRLVVAPALGASLVVMLVGPVGRRTNVIAGSGACCGGGFGGGQSLPRFDGELAFSHEPP